MAYPNAALDDRPYSSKHPSSPLHDKVDRFLADQYTFVVHRLLDCPIAIGDQNDGRGQFITKWDVSELGPAPTAADGFTADELRHIEGRP
jgi:hypothetical protein